MRAAAVALAAVMSEEQRAGVTLHPLGLGAFQGATARIHWTVTVAEGHEEAWTAPAPVPGMTFLTAGPEGTTLPQHHGTQEEDPGARMMRAAVGEEEEEEGGEEVGAGLTNLPATLSMNLDRNQEDGGMNDTL